MMFLSLITLTQCCLTSICFNLDLKQELLTKHSAVVLSMSRIMGLGTVSRVGKLHADYGEGGSPSMSVSD